MGTFALASAGIALAQTFAGLVGICGALLLIAGLTGLALALVQAPAWGWTSLTVIGPDAVG
jgi:hypothetical protein